MNKSELNELALKLTADLTEEQSDELYRSNWWQNIELHNAAWLQLHQKHLIMPIPLFQAGAEVLLGRGVSFYELWQCRKELIEEAIKRPGFEEIISFGAEISMEYPTDAQRAEAKAIILEAIQSEPKDVSVLIQLLVTHQIPRASATARDLA